MAITAAPARNHRLEATRLHFVRGFSATSTFRWVRSLEPSTCSTRAANLYPCPGTVTMSGRSVGGFADRAFRSRKTLWVRLPSSTAAFPQTACISSSLVNSRWELPAMKSNRSKARAGMEIGLPPPVRVRFAGSTSNPSNRYKSLISKLI